MTPVEATVATLGLATPDGQTVTVTVLKVIVSKWGIGQYYRIYIRLSSYDGSHGGKESNNVELHFDGWFNLLVKVVKRLMISLKR